MLSFSNISNKQRLRQTRAVPVG